MTSISHSVLSNLSSDTLRTIQHELIVTVEALQADGIRPTKGVAVAIREINDVLGKREGY